MKPRIGSLFSGSGMLDEGVRSVLGGDVAWHAEVDPAACKVLAHRYPDVPNLGDITAIKWTPDCPSCGEPLALYWVGQDAHRAYWCRQHGEFPLSIRTPDVADPVEDVDAGRLPQPSTAEDASDALHIMRDDGAAACASHRPEPGEQRTDQPGSAVRVMSHAAALAGGPGQAASGSPEGWQCGCTAYGQYAPAIHRWEILLGRPAPSPTKPGPRGGQRLSPSLTEFMMGWPDGWVTDVPGVSRNDALRICGNGVVPQQAAEAIRRMLSATVEAVA